MFLKEENDINYDPARGRWYDSKGMPVSGFPDSDEPKINTKEDELRFEYQEFYGDYKIWGDGK